MYRQLSYLLLMTMLLSGCARDINLAKDVDLLAPTPKPGLDQIMDRQAQEQKPSINSGQGQQYSQQRRTQQMQQQQDQPISQPTPTPSPNNTEPATVSGKQADTVVEIHTARGTVRLKLFTSEAINTVKNFLSKARSGFYNGLTFHRVESWVVQGGDPKGNGTGGGSMTTELNQIPFKTGSVGVARGGDIKVSNDAQFFICTEDCSWLTGQYTNFGEVVSGMDVVKQIAIGDKIQSITEAR